MSVNVIRLKSEEILIREGSEPVKLHGIYFLGRSAQSVDIEAIGAMEPNTNFYKDFCEFLIPDPSLSEGELFIVPENDAVRSFARYSVARPELRGIFVCTSEIVYPLRFSFISPIFGRIPFLFLVAFLRRLVGISPFC